MIEEGYRIPTIDEFVQGFKFELRKDYSFGFITLGKGYEKVKDYSIWTECEVWWKSEEKWITQSYEDGTKFTMSGSTNNFFKPFDEKSFLDQGLIRVKI